MKEVSGNTWVQKAVFLEPKALFSSAFTMCSRGWYLCMELRMIWKRRVSSELRVPTLLSSASFSWPGAGFPCPKHLGSRA